MAIRISETSSRLREAWTPRRAEDSWDAQPAVYDIRFFCMFLQPRHDADEVAGTMADVELVFEDVVPAILHSAGRTGQGRDSGPAGDTCAGTRLNGRSPDRGKAHLMKQHREAVDLLLEDRAKRFDGNVTAGEAGAAVRDNRVDFGIYYPASQLRDNLWLVVAKQITGREHMTQFRDAREASVSPDVLFEASRVSETVSTAMRTEQMQPSRQCGMLASLISNGSEGCFCGCVDGFTETDVVGSDRWAIGRLPSRRGSAHFPSYVAHTSSNRS